MSTKTVLKKKAVIDPEKKSFINIIGKCICETKNIESLKDQKSGEYFKSVKQRTTFESVNDMPDTLQDIYSDVVSTMELNHDLKTTAIVYSPQDHVDKKKIYNLPNYNDNVICRVVVVYGSHEIFYSKRMNKILGNIGSFVNQGQAIKFIPTSGSFYYDNKDTYDAEMYSGSGNKRPTSRQLIIFDFFSDSEDDKKKVNDKEISRITGLITKIPKASNIILPLLNSLISSKTS